MSVKPTRLARSLRCVSAAWTLLFFLPLGLRAQDTEGGKYALLIGVDEYANLSPAEQLDGSANDIALISSVLTSRFNFDQDNIIQRLNSEATGAGIRSAFAELVEKIESLPDNSPTAQVYFHFSGHGSQILDQEEGHQDRDEQDGLDETLVPHDAERQGGAQDIRDDEINDLINQVVGDPENPKARVILVYDCCHSGSGARGATKVRQLSRKIADSSKPENVTRKRLPPGVVFLSACHETEVEPEFQENGKTYGLLTRFLSQVLTEHASLSELSYDSLHDAIRSRYQTNRKVVQAPHPQLEASDIETRKLPVLGATRAIDRPTNFPLAGKDSSGAVRLKAGTLHGLNTNALLEVYENPEAASAGEAIGTVKIKSVTEFESQAEFVSFDEAKQVFAKSNPPTNSLAVAVASMLAPAPATSQIGLKLIRSDASGEPKTAKLDDLPTALAKQIQQLVDGGEVSLADENPDLVLKVSGELSSLFPSTGSALNVSSEDSSAPAILRGGWGPFDSEGLDSEGNNLGDYLNRILKAQNLVSLTSASKNKTHSDYKVEYQLLKAEINEDGEILSTEEIEPTFDKRTLLEIGTAYAVQFKNSEDSKGPLYFTALEVTP
ncbi:MAG: caspase family protein, partial [Planctomycetota bacterium]